jgi:hypothetical protein
MRKNPKPTLEQLVDYRLADIAEASESGLTEMTGKLRRDYVPEHPWELPGEVVGRFGGMKRGLYPELEALSEGPKVIGQAIRRGKGKVYERVRQVVADAMSKETDSYRVVKKRSPGRASVAPHEGRPYCLHCRATHTKGQHRFHGPGSFHATHLWAFNPMTVKEAKYVHELLTSGKRKLTPEARALLTRATQTLRQARKPAKNPLPRLSVSQILSRSGAEFIGEVVELRYERMIGAHPGLYKHIFKTRADVLCLPDGSILIKPRG